MKTKSQPIPVCKTMCATCPFREGSKHAALAPMLTEASFHTARICHSTGNNALMGRTGKPSRICRGSRDIQLKLFQALGVLTAATDEAWQEALVRLRADKKR